MYNFLISHISSSSSSIHRRLRFLVLIFTKKQISVEFDQQKLRERISMVILLYLFALLISELNWCNLKMWSIEKLCMSVSVCVFALKSEKQTILLRSISKLIEKIERTVANR